MSFPNLLNLSFFNLFVKKSTASAYSLKTGVIFELTVSNSTRSSAISVIYGHLMKLNPDKICAHLHLSLQSGSDAVLKRMKRPYTSRNFKLQVEAVYKYLVNKDKMYWITDMRVEPIKFP